jgi:DNA-binding GntR family transcriptional regulator
MTEVLDGIGPNRQRVPEAPATRAARVAEKLRDLIAQDELPPGTRLRERDLAQRLSVSRTPMREALRILAAEGLVTLAPNRGAVVARPGPKEVQDLLALLGALESLAGEQAALRATAEEIAEVRARHHEMLAAFARRDRLAYFKCNQAIHRAIVQASGNAALIAMHEQTNARVYRVRYSSNLSAGNWQHAVDSHEAILAALEARDGEHLAGLLKHHLDNTWRNTRDLIAPVAGQT